MQDSLFNIERETGESSTTSKEPITVSDMPFGTDAVENHSCPLQSAAFEEDRRYRTNGSEDKEDYLTETQVRKILSTEDREDGDKDVVMIMTSANTGSFRAVGVLPADILMKTGAFYSLGGWWVRDSSMKYTGKLFRFDCISPALPHDRDMALSFLKYKGFCKGLPAKTAEAIIDKLGDDALVMIEQDPSCLDGIKGVGAIWKERIPEAIRNSRAAEIAFKELYAAGIRRESIFKLYDVYKEDTVARVYADPYGVAEANGDAYSFLVADCIAWNHGLSPYAPFRITAGIREVLRNNMQEGHTYMRLPDMKRAVVQLLEQKPDMAIGNIKVDGGWIEKGIDENLPSMISAGRVIVVERSNGMAVYLSESYEAEVETAYRLKDLSLCDAEIEKCSAAVANHSSSTNFSDEQNAAIEGALSNWFSIITGGPGTGKTTVMAEIVRRHKAMGRTVLLAAPTAKAADRMKDVTGAPAMTIQRMLGFKPYGAPTFNEDRPLDANVVIVDEFSMVDMYLLRDLLRAICPSTFLIAIGDVDQLPSVGAGNVLSDLIDCAQFPVFRLQKIFRQSRGSSIPEQARNVNNGIMPSFSYDFRALWLNSDDIRSALVETVTDTIPEFFFRTPEEIRVLTPLRGGSTGACEYSRILREVLNPPADANGRLKPEMFGFRIGDRVMQNVNSYRLGAMNGDEGIVTSMDADERTITVTYSDKSIEYRKRDIDESRLEISYVTTVHKSQGSEYPVVLIVLPNEAGSLVSRRLLYTAVTRAKEAVLIMGNRDVLVRGLSSSNLIHRNTGMTDLLVRDLPTLYGLMQDKTGKNDILHRDNEKSQLGLFDEVLPEDCIYF